MIIIDSREEDMIPKLPEGQVVDLEFGDYAITGNGPEGSVIIGIERKRIRDLIGSMQSGRLAGHQLPGLLEAYDYPILLIEGEWKDSNRGVQVRSGKGWKPGCFGRRVVHWSQIWMYITAINIQMGVNIIQTKDIGESVGYIRAVDTWINKEWNKHKAMDVKHRPDTFRRIRTRASFFKRIAIELPKISVGRYAAVEKEFSSVKEMINASVDRWEGIEGVGAGIAKQIVKKINEEH